MRECCLPPAYLTPARARGQRQRCGLLHPLAHLEPAERGITAPDFCLTWQQNQKQIFFFSEPEKVAVRHCLLSSPEVQRGQWALQRRGEMSEWTEVVSHHNVTIRTGAEKAKG